MSTWRERLDIRAALQRSGWTALFAAVSVVVYRAENFDLELRSFAGRVVSLATIMALDIGARTALFASSVVLFVLCFFAGLAVLHALRKILAAKSYATLEALSIGGLALWVARAYTLEVHALIWLVAALEIAVVVIGLLDRVVFRAGEHPESAAYFTSLSLLAVGLLFAASDWRERCLPNATPWLNLYVAFLVVGIHVCLRILCWRGEEGRRRAAIICIMAALAPAACLPLISMLREELYLTINNRGFLSVRPGHVQIMLLAGLTAWGLVRYVRSARAGAPPLLEKFLLRFGLPMFAFGLSAYGRYVPIIYAPTDLFEPANSGLEVQQWFDFGRLPYIETFNAHGFSESLWNFLFCIFQGPHRRTFHFYLFLDDALATILIYYALRRATGNGYLAFFCAALFPFRPALFPNYSALALACVFVLEWLLARPILRRWIVFGFYCAACILWRMDVGVANIAASAVTIAAVWYLRKESRPRVRDVLLAGALCAVVCAGTFFAFSLARGVDPWMRLMDLRHIVNSAQSSGYLQIANTFDPSVFWHLGVFPLGVLAVFGWVLWSRRTTSKTLAPSFLVLLLLYGGAYYFANYQRGLVRHNFCEPGNVYVLSFGFTVLSLAPYLWSRFTSEKAMSAAFLGVSCLLGGSFGLMGTLPAAAPEFTSAWQRAAERRVSTPPFEYSPEIVDRSPMPPDYMVHHYGAITDFVQRMLTPKQTFLDLTNSPVLYVETHRLSPHYMNHLLVVHDEWLQKSQLLEFARHDIPFVLVWQEQDLSALDDVMAGNFNTADGVANNLRYFHFHEWLHARYEPWCIVQRWQVWRRKDWLAPSVPTETDARELSAYRGAVPGDGRVVLSPYAGDPDVDPQPTADRQPFLCVRGSATHDGELGVRISVAGADEAASTHKRTLEISTGQGPWYWTLPVELLGRSVTSIELDFARAPGFALNEAVVLDAPAPSYTMIADRLHPLSVHELGAIPWLWANVDERDAIARPVIKTLYESGSGGLRELRIEPRTGPRFDRGINRYKPAFYLADVSDAQWLKVGDHVRFAAGGERLVESIEAPRVFVSGEPLDPIADGAPHVAYLVPSEDTSLAGVIRMSFAPLDDPVRPCYVAVRLRAAAEGGRAAISWGQDDRALGRFEFQLMGRGPQDYLFRISSQSSWALTHCNWLDFEKLDHDTELFSVKLLEGD